MAHWIAKSDFYDPDNMKHLLYFDSFDELEDRLHNTDFDGVHSKMVAHHRGRSAQVHASWKEVTNTLAERISIEQHEPPVVAGIAQASAVNEYQPLSQ
jgi:hypothetical protein